MSESFSKDYSYNKLIENENIIEVYDNNKENKNSNEEELDTEKEEKKQLHSVKKKIINEIIVPNYYIDLEQSINNRRNMFKNYYYFDLFHRISAGASTVMAFSAGVYSDLTYLSFVAGALGTLSLVSLQFSKYCKNESKKNTEQTNIILDKLGLSNIPDIISKDENV
jgi:fructose-1-phosphate kinase PfkB-like protein